MWIFLKSHNQLKTLHNRYQKKNTKKIFQRWLYSCIPEAHAKSENYRTKFFFPSYLNFLRSTINYKNGTKWEGDSITRKFCGSVFAMAPIERMQICKIFHVQQPIRTYIKRKQESNYLIFWQCSSNGIPQAHTKFEKKKSIRLFLWTDGDHSRGCWIGQALKHSLGSVRKKNACKNSWRSNLHSDVQNSGKLNCQKFFPLFLFLFFVQFRPLSNCHKKRSKSNFSESFFWNVKTFTREG